jgi:hypothetical protein
MVSHRQPGPLGQNAGFTPSGVLCWEEPLAAPQPAAYLPGPIRCALTAKGSGDGAPSKRLNELHIVTQGTGVPLANHHVYLSVSGTEMTHLVADGRGVVVGTLEEPLLLDAARTYYVIVSAGPLKYPASPREGTPVCVKAGTILIDPFKVIKPNRRGRRRWMG